MWLKKKCNKFPKGTLWQRGYFVSTIGLNENQIKKYIENQSYHQVALVRGSLTFQQKPPSFLSDRRAQGEATSLMLVAFTECICTMKKFSEYYLLSFVTLF
jgi:hypothetical protein